MDLPLFPTDDEVADLASTLRSQGDRPEARTLTALSWALRQRDGARATALADQACTRGGADPRLDLVRAEVHWLQGRRDEAGALARATLRYFESLSDGIGCGDTLWLLAHVAREDGQGIDGLLAEAEAHYRRAGDGLRSRLVQLRRYSDAGPVYADDAWDRWQTFNAGAGDLEVPAVVAWHRFIEAAIQGLRGHLADSVTAGGRAYQASVATGQINSAVFCATNVGIFFDKLNDLESALDWARRGLEQARRLGSRRLQAQSLGMLGHALLRLQRFEAAHPVLEEGLRNSVPGSGPHCNILTSLGQLALGTGDGDTAYRRFSEVIAAYAGLPTAVAAVQPHLAQAALLQGRTDEAHAICDGLLQHSREAANVPGIVELLLLKARIFQRERQARDGEVSADRTAMSCLQEALRLAESTDGMLVSQDLLDAIAQESAALGDMAQAYVFAQRARQAAETIRSRQAHDRAAALQVQHQTERLTLEADHERERSLQEKRRAEELARANATLERLGVVGREITAASSEHAVCETIERHVHDLLDAHAIAVFLLDEPAQALRLLFGREGGQDLAPLSVALDDPDRLVSRCARERHELMLHGDASATASVAGTRPTRSLMFAPLLLGDRLVGVLTVQSLHPQAYGEREVAIFRSLCAYGAIALVNAQALAALNVAQERLVAQNAELARLAGTDRLTGLPNRRQLDHVLGRELAASRRGGTPFSLLILDIDHFKRINDRFGHLVGDLVLESVGRWLSDRVRGGDVPGRWGGEEFVVIFPGTDLAGAVQAAEALRTSFERCEHPHVGRCQASLGVACYRPGDDASSLTERADRALYKAKSGGRNRVGVEEGAEQVSPAPATPE